MHFHYQNKKRNIMALVKMWVHAVWATKNREPLLVKGLRRNLFIHIRENAVMKNIHIDFINGYEEHIHCLVSLNPEQSIAKVIQLIKGERSFWINRNKLCEGTFEWQEEFCGVGQRIKIGCSERIYKEPGKAPQ
jgi:putative transposase